MEKKNTVFDLRYAQYINGKSQGAEFGPSIATFWNRPKYVPSDCEVFEVELTQAEMDIACKSPYTTKEECDLSISNHILSLKRGKE